MAFAKVYSFFTSLLSAQTIEPLIKNGGYKLTMIGSFFAGIWQAIVSLFYWIVKWLLALVDFLQYFVQKLIGLDYWLNNTVYSFKGALENDILFSFLYDDTIQNVFRALCGVFVVLLIIFTIFAIIRSEWQYITGDGFGDGKNSKVKIMRDAIKAIGLVLIFPLVLMIGIISANAILASLVKALNIDMGTSFGSTLFYIGSQSANKYKVYADGGVRSAVSDEVTFYITQDGKYLTIGTGTGDAYTEYATNYADYIKNLENCKRYTVNSMFEPINMGASKEWSGYCCKLIVDGEATYYMVTADDDDKNAMYYYLRCVLNVPVMNKNDNIGNKDIFAHTKNKMDDRGFITGLDLSDFVNGEEITNACHRTLNYSSIYQTQKSFESCIDISVLTGDNLTRFGINGVSNARVMYNSDLISPYFDGGMFGVQQLQAEYNVMGEVIDFMNNTGATLYILDATSPLIKWDDSQYQIDSKWMAKYTEDYDKNNINAKNGSNELNYCYNTNHVKTVMPFLVSYSEMCSDTEQGNVLYFAQKDKSNELEGSLYIMCLKQTVTKDGNTVSRYLPLVNGKTYKDPVTNKTLNFKSDYYASNYRGVVIAKGTFDTSSTDGVNGLPTYLKSASSYGSGKHVTDIADDEPYYYKMEASGGLLQFAKSNGITQSIYDFTDASLSSTYSNDYYVDSSHLASNRAALYGTEQYFNIIDKQVSTNKVTSNDIVQNLSIQLKDSSASWVATYAGQSVQNGSTGTKYLFEVVGNFEYFVVETETATGNIYIRSLEQIADSLSENKIENSAIKRQNMGSADVPNFRYWTTLKTVTIDYTIYSVYKNTAFASGKSNFAQVVNEDIKPGHLVYSTIKNGKSVFRTESMEWIKLHDGANDYGGTSQYVSIFFDTTSQELVSLKDTMVNFALPITPTVFDDGGTIDENKRYSITDWNESYMQNSAFYRFNLYNYYTGYVITDTGTELYEYNYSSDEVDTSPVDVPSPDDEKWSFLIKIDDQGFEFLANDDSLGLYDGGKYIATIYKPIGTACANHTNLSSVTTSILYNYNTYYNVETTNKYGTVNDMQTEYKNMRRSFITACTRDNLGTIFWLDLSISGFIKIQSNFDFMARDMDRREISTTFKLSDGVGFDYFFDNDISLHTFYVPSKVSYWIILIAASLIIKVLSTAIWGVIKRFYEITLYFVAMPAVASTIPLDGGTRFTKSIQTPLISKVLMTYGVILGLNLFFVLLAPIKSVSNVFTAEDIATSGSYFLKHLPISYKMLNLYVYILFILVAFTMINALPSLISSMVGGDDAVKVGSDVKSQATNALKSAGDVMSGKAIAEAPGKALEMAKNLPGAAIVGGAAKQVKKFHDWRKERKERGKGEGEDEVGGGGGDGGEQKDSKSREDEDDTSKKPPEVENEKTSPNDDETEKIPTNTPLNEDQIKQAIENGQALSLDKDGNVIIPEDDGEPKDLTDEEAEQKIQKDVEKNGGVKGEEITDEQQKETVANNTDKEEIIAIVKTMLENFAKKNGLATEGNTKDKINAAMFGGTNNDGKEVKGKVSAGDQVNAILSTMSEQERKDFEDANEGNSDEAKLEQLTKSVADGGMGYRLDANVDEDGNLKGFNAIKKDKDGNETTKAVTGDASAELLKAAVKNSSAEEVATATIENGAEEEIAKTYSNNILSGVDLGTLKNNDSTLAANITAFASRTSAEGGDDSIVSEAMLDSLDSKELAKFQKKAGINGDISKDPEARKQAIDSITKLRNSSEDNFFNKMDPSRYEEKVLGVVERRSKEGTYSINAWDFKKFTDPEGAKELIEQKKAEAKAGKQDVLEGASVAEKNEAIANAANKFIENDPKSQMAQNLQNIALAATIDEKTDFATENLNAIRALTGKNNVNDLTEKDKALLGYAKSTHDGKLAGIENLDEKDIKLIKDGFNSTVQKGNVVRNLGTQQLGEALRNSRYASTLEKSIKNDSMMGISSDDIIKESTNYVKAGKLSKAQTDALSNMMKVDDITKADDKEIAKFLKENKDAANVVTSAMKNDEAQAEKLNKKVNAGFEQKIVKTDAEMQVEQDLSKEEVDEATTKSKDLLYNAITNTSSINADEKNVLVRDALNAFNSTQNTTTEGIVDYVKQRIAGGDKDKDGKVKNGEDEFNQLKSLGYSDEDIAVAMQAAVLAGDDVNSKGNLKGGDLITVLEGYLNDTKKTNDAILNGMKVWGGEAYQNAAESLNQNLSEQQKSTLKDDIAKSGFNGLSSVDQNNVLVDMVKQNPNLMSAMGIKENDEYAELKILGYLNDEKHKDEKDALVKKANSMSYYELNHRFIEKDKQSAKDVHSVVQEKVKQNETVDKIYNEQQNLIGNKEMLETLKGENAPADAVNSVAETFAQNVNTLTKDEKEQAAHEAQINKIAEIYGVSDDKSPENLMVEIMGETDPDKQKQIESEVQQKGATVALDYVYNNHRQAIDSIIASTPDLQYLKEGNVDYNKFTAEEKQKIYETLTTSGQKYAELLGSDSIEDIKNINKETKENYVIQKYVEQDAETNRNILDVVADEAIENKNKQKLARGGAEKVNEVGEKLWEDDSTRKDAEKLYAKLNNGKKLSEIDEQTRNSFLAEHFSDRLSEEEMDKIEKKIIQELQKLGIIDPSLGEAEIEDLIKDAKKNKVSVFDQVMNNGFVKDKEKYNNPDKINELIVKSMNADNLSFTIDKINREEMGEGEGTNAIANLKKQYIKNNVDSLAKIDNTNIVDESKLSKTELRDLNYNINMLAQQIKTDEKGNPVGPNAVSIMANLFKNTSLVNDKDSFNKILQMHYDVDSFEKLNKDQKLELLQKTGNFDKMVKDYVSKHPGVKEKQAKNELVKNATWQDMKQGLDNNKIFEFLNKKENANIKDNLVKIGANNVMLTLDKNEQRNRKIEAVKNNNVLNNQVVDKILASKLDKNGNHLDDNKIKDLIKQMLEKQRVQDPKTKKMEFVDKNGKTIDDANVDKYIAANLRELKNELVLHLGEGLQVSSKETEHGKQGYMDAIAALEKKDNVFASQVYKNVTHSVSYAANASEQDKDIFFADKQNKEAQKAYKENQYKFSKRRHTLQDGIEAFLAGSEDVKNNFGEVYNQKHRLPKNSKAYLNWNNAIDKQIDQIERGVGDYAGMTKAQKLAEKAKLEAKKIWVGDQKPKDYYNMTAQEKLAFDEQQNLNKNQAINAKEYSSFYKKNVKISNEKSKSVSKKFAANQGEIYTYGNQINTKRKKKHNDKLLDIDSKIATYNATKHMRNSEIDFGNNFEKFASNYLTPNQLKTMMKRYKLASDAEYKNVNEGDEEATKFSKMMIRQKRERAMADYMNELRRNAAKKVKKDHKRSESFLVERGIEADTAYGTVRYKDGSKKYNKEQSKLSAKAEKMKFNKTEGGRRMIAENKIAYTERLQNEINDFNGTYKGNSKEYIDNLKKHLTEKGFDTGLIDKLVNKHLKNALFGRLDQKPLAVQIREIMKGLGNDVYKNEKRLQSLNNNAYIPVNSKSDAVSKFVGKTFTGAKTDAEVKSNEQRADDFTKAMNIFARNASQIVDIRTLINTLPVTVQDAIKRNLEKRLEKEQDFNNQLKMLQRFLKNQEAKTRKIVNKDNFFKSEKKELTKLGGILVTKKAVRNPSMYGPAAAKLNPTDLKIRESLVSNETSIKNKLKAEEQKLFGLINSVSNAKTMKERKTIRQSIESTEKRVSLYKTMLKSAETRRKEFEKTVASKNDKAVKSKLGSFGASNKGSVLDSYSFTKNGAAVVKGTTDARQIEQIVREHIAKQVGILDNMSAKYTHKAVSDLKNKIDRIRNTMDNDFGKSLRDLKRVQRELMTTLDNLKKTNKAEYADLVSKIKDDSDNLDKVEQNLIARLQQMGIDISQVRKINVK